MSTDLGEWDDPPRTPTPPVAVPQAVADAVTRAVTARLTELLADPIDTALTAPDGQDRWTQLEHAATNAVEQLFAPDPAPPGLYYSTVDDFVREFVCHVYRRNVGDRADHRWAARWWESPEAIIRLEAMWRSWEALRLNPATGISDWFRDHADHHMAILLSPTGPFARSTDTAKTTEPLPYEPPPEGLFTAG